MNRCLSDRALWRIHEGEAPAAERNHAAACLGCAARYQRLVRDVAALGETLRAAPAGARAGRRWPRGSRQLAVAAALVAVVGLAAIQAWNVAAPARSAAAVTAEESVAFLQEVSDVLGSTGGLGGTGLALALALPDGADAVPLGWPGDRDDGLWVGSTGDAVESSVSVR
jgi:hypothetical protein